jgi:hypothetical protein
VKRIIRPLFGPIFARKKEGPEGVSFLILVKQKKSKDLIFPLVVLVTFFFNLGPSPSFHCRYLANISNDGLMFLQVEFCCELKAKEKYRLPLLVILDYSEFIQ